MSLSFHSLTHRAKRESYAQIEREKNMSPEQRYELELERKNDVVRFKLNVQIFISIFLTLISIYLIFNLSSIDMSGENLTNAVTLFISAIFCDIYTAIRVKKYKRGDYDVR